MACWFRIFAACCLWLSGTSHAAQDVMAFQFGSGAKVAVAIVSADTWANDETDSRMSSSIAEPLWHLRSVDGLIGGPSYLPLLDGDLLAPSKTCPLCKSPLFLYREDTLIKSTGGSGDALTHCTAQSKSKCFHIYGMSLRIVELGTGAVRKYRPKSTHELFANMFPSPPERLSGKTASPGWGAKLIPVATAIQLADEAERRRVDVEQTLRQEWRRYEELVREAEIRALDLVRNGRSGEQRTCSTPAGLSQAQGTPVGAFEVACNEDWPALPNQLPATVRVKEFLSNGWSIVQQDLVTNSDTTRIYLYLVLKRIR